MAKAIFQATVTTSSTWQETASGGRGNVQIAPLKM